LPPLFGADAPCRCFICLLRRFISLFSSAAFRFFAILIDYLLPLFDASMLIILLTLPMITPAERCRFDIF